VLGIGVNVAVRLEELPPELRAEGRAADAADADAGLPAATMGLPAQRIEPLLDDLLAALERRLGEPAELTLRAWRDRDALRDREIAWAHTPFGSTGGRGRAQGIDEQGRLLVVLADGGSVALGAGEVHLQRLA